MRWHIGSTALCRTPAFSYQYKLPEVWDDLKGAIRDSAKEFFDKIGDIKADDLSQLDAKSRYTLWKYHNRACFRATPFGRFAAITPVPVHTEEVGRVRLESAVQVHSWPDWQPTESAEATSSIPFTHVQVNGSAYRCGDDIRYLFRSGTNFELAAVPYLAGLWSLLSNGTVPSSRGEMVTLISSTLELNGEDAGELLQQLINLQLLITDSSPNITGPEYFARTGIAIQLDKQYTICERTLASGALQVGALQPLTEFAEWMARSREVATPANLKTFMTAFTAKFENREVPLLTALDPEMGVGYGLLEQALGTNPQIEALKKNKAAKKTGVADTRLHRFLLRALAENKDRGPIALEAFVPDVNPKTPVLPNSMGVIVRFSDDLLVVENGGGCTATSLLGRFSLPSEAVADYCRELAAAEAAANPDVIFFDLAYVANKVVDNVSRRRQIYAYELPLLCWSCSEDALALSDIMVCIRSGQVVLRSIKHGKRLIPRFASAYNYTLSDLPVFTFLCDLQFQGLATNATFSLPPEFPGLAFYPRVQYKNVVVSPARWQVPKRFINAKESELPKLLPALNDWVLEQGIGGAFKAGMADQMLCFDPAKPEDLEAFLYYCKGKQELYISEALLPKQSNVHDGTGKPYLAEYIVTLQHTGKVYNGLSNLSDRPPARNVVSGILPPGGEWLYFQVYCHTSRANELLTGPLRTFLSHHQAAIRQSFFIRYADPGTHIRLRVQLMHSDQGYVLIRELSTHLAPYLEAKLVTDLQVRTYFREMVRYGDTGIETVEACFAADSTYVLTLLDYGFTDDQRYFLTQQLLKRLLDGLLLPLEQQLVVVNRFAEYFARELELEGNGTKQLNEYYKKFRQQTVNFVPPHTLPDQLGNVAVMMIQVLQQTTEDVTIRLLGDLFHMHINRVFKSDQRVHELVAYYYTMRGIQEERGRKQASVAKEIVDG